MTSRVSLYNEIHKGLRRQLFTLVLDCGNRDPEDEAEVSALVGRFRDLQSFLSDHAGHEEQWVEPILEKLRPELAAELANEHERLHERLSAVAVAFAAWAEAPARERAAAGMTAYGALSAFVGAYVTHMSREDDEAMPVIQAAMTDEQILEVSAKLRASIPPPRMAEFVSFMLPAMNVVERSAMFSGLKAAAPAEVLDGMCQLAAGVLDSGDWSSVRERVGL